MRTCERQPVPVQAARTCTRCRCCWRCRVMRSNADQNTCTCTSCVYLYAVLCDEVGCGRVRDNLYLYELRVPVRAACTCTRCRVMRSDADVCSRRKLRTSCDTLCSRTLSITLSSSLIDRSSPWMKDNICNTGLVDTTHPVRTRSSAIAEGRRDASCQLKSCQLPLNSAETTCTTNPEQIEVMKLEG